VCAYQIVGGNIDWSVVSCVWLDNKKVEYVLMCAWCTCCLGRGEM
jgi:hypothetical protein